MDSKITPNKILDEILNCFYEAHCANMGFTESIDNADAKEYCKSLVEQAFVKTSGDFHKPTKESLIKVIDWLAKFSSNFRSQQLVKKHYFKIMKLIDQLG